MKIAKIKIIKKRNAEDTECLFEYPEGYDEKIVSPICYQDENNNTEFCIATVPDDFKFTADMVEQTKENAEKEIDSYVNENRFIKANLKLTAEDVTKIKDNKKACIQS